MGVLFTIFGVKTHADDYVDGIYYKFNFETKTAEVTRESYDFVYYGNIEIPETVEYQSVKYTVKRIKGDTFSGSHITSISIPSTIESIGMSAFYGCNELTSVHISDLKAWCNIEFHKESNYLSNPLRYAHHLFLNGEEIQDLVIPEDIKGVKDGAFAGNYFKSVTLHSGIDSIGRYAFNPCDQLEKVISYIMTPFGFDVDRFGRNTSQGMPNYDITLYVPKGTLSLYRNKECWKYFAEFEEFELSCIVDGIYYNLNQGKRTAEVTRSKSYSGDIVIPSTITYSGNIYSVTSIGKDAFLECSGLTSITIPNSVTSIGEEAFEDCTGLTSVTIPNSVNSIGSDAFRSCSGLTSITVESGNTKYDSRNSCNAIIETATNTLILGCKNTIIPNNVITIGDAAFSNCIGLTSISIPNSVTTIGSYVFNECTSLTSITIPNSVTSIEAFTFHKCSGLTSVTLPNSVINIGESAFYKCTGLLSITIPNSVTSIGEYAFEACTGLTSVTIGNSVTTIKTGAFSGCSGLTSIISLATAPPGCESYVFYHTDTSVCKLFVPKGSKSYYQNASVWKDFVFIEEGVPAGIKVVENTNCNTTIYDLNGVRHAESKKGLNIIQGRKVFIK